MTTLLSNAQILAGIEWLIRIGGYVVEDGTWFERHLTDRLLDPSTAAEAASLAVRDPHHGEVILAAGVLEAFYCINGVPAAAWVAALREVWIDHGLVPEDGNLTEVTQIFREAVHHASDALMTATELATLAALPPVVTVYRGQKCSDGCTRPSNVSWTLRRQVADWYSVPIHSLGEPQGWILSTRVPKSAIIALFDERGEHEVVIDFPGLPRNQRISAERGSCKRFPQHLAGTRTGSNGSGVVEYGRYA